MNRIFSTLLVTFLTLLLLPTTFGQDTGTARELNDKASKAFQAGQYEETVKYYQEFIKRFPDSPAVAGAKYSIGISYHMLGKYKESISYLEEGKGFSFPKNIKPIAGYYLSLSYLQVGEEDKAIKTLQSILNLESEIKESIFFQIGDAYLTKAKRLLGEKKEKAADQAFKEAIKTFNQQIEKFPNGEAHYEALIKCADAYSQIKQFEKAIESFKKLQESDPDPAIMEEMEIRSGDVLQRWAKHLIHEFHSEEASKVISRARKIYEKLSKSKNLTQANQAIFNLATLYLEDKNYSKAIETFRTVKSKPRIIENQRQRIEDIRKELGTLDAEANKGRFNHLQHNLRREQAILLRLEKDPELAILAYIQIGVALQNQANYNAARTIFRHLEPFAEKNHKVIINSNLIISYALQGLTAEAEKYYQQFQKQFAGNPAAEVLTLSLIQSYHTEGRYNEAIDKCNDFRKRFPTSRLVPEVIRAQASALQAQKKNGEALKLYDGILKDFETQKIKAAAESIDEVRRLRALALWGQNMKKEAIEAVKELIKKGSNVETKESAALQLANFYLGNRQIKEALDSYKDFVKQYPKSANVPDALFQIASIEQRRGKEGIQQAITYYKQLIHDHPESKLIPDAYNQLCLIHLASGEVDAATQIKDTLLKKYGDAPIIVSVLYYLGDYFEKKAETKNYPLATDYYLQAYDFYKKMLENNSPNAHDDAVLEYSGASLIRATRLKRKQATALGIFLELGDSEKKKWGQLMFESQELLKGGAIQFAGTKYAPYAVSALIEVQIDRIKAGEADADKILKELAVMIGEIERPLAKSQLEIARVSLLYQLGKRSQALQFYKDLFNQIKDPSLIPPKEYVRYAQLLRDTGNSPEAYQFYDKIIKLFAKNSKLQEIAIMGKALCLIDQTKLDEAEGICKEFLQKYPNAYKSTQAKSILALADAKRGNHAKAFDTWLEILKSRRGGTELQAEIMLNIGKTLKDTPISEIQEHPIIRPKKDQPPIDPKDQAVSYLIRIPLLYPAYPDIASEALYRAAVIYKEQGNKAKLQETLSQQIQNYPSSPWTQKARELSQ